MWYTKDLSFFVLVSWAWSTSVSVVLTWTVRLDKTGGLTNPSQVGVGPGNQKLSYQDETTRMLVTLMNPENHLNSPVSAAWPAQDFPIPVVPTWPGCFTAGNSLHRSKFEDIKVFKVGQKQLSASRSRSSDFRWMRRYLPWGKDHNPGRITARIANRKAMIFPLIELKM